jgi:hypothetical protein
VTKKKTQGLKLPFSNELIKINMNDENKTVNDYQQKVTEMRNANSQPRESSH